MYTAPIWVSLMSPGESIMGLLIAVLILNQVPVAMELVGGAILISGVVIVLIAESSPATTA